MVDDQTVIKIIDRFDNVADQVEQTIRLAIAELNQIRLTDKLDRARMDGAIKRLRSLL